MRKRYIFARRRQRRGRIIAAAIAILLGLAIWSGSAQDPQLPPIYLKAAPFEPLDERAAPPEPRD
jgi:hypothetical protein